MGRWASRMSMLAPSRTARSVGQGMRRSKVARTGAASADRRLRQWEWGPESPGEAAGIKRRSNSFRTTQPDSISVLRIRNSDALGMPVCKCNSAKVTAEDCSMACITIKPRLSASTDFTLLVPVIRDNPVKVSLGETMPVPPALCNIELKSSTTSSLTWRTE